MFELILSPLISVKFKLSNSVYEMNLMALRKMQSMQLTSIKGHINPFRTGCYPGWRQSARPTEYLLPNSSIRLVSRLLLTLLTLCFFLPLILSPFSTLAEHYLTPLPYDLSCKVMEMIRESFLLSIQFRPFALRCLLIIPVDTGS